MKDFVYKHYKSFKQKTNLVRKKVSRLFLNTKMQNFDFYNVPIIINNRNRYTFLKQLINWLESNGYTNISVLDNNSDYAPLLNYYKTIKHKVIFLNQNLGYKALWLSPIFHDLKNSYYVYTDPDVLPQHDCPKNVVEQLYNVLNKYKKIEKAGVALKIDDIPDFYKNKNEVLRIESQWWSKKIENLIYDAPVDTTFALYRPLAKGDAEECKAYRVAGKLTFIHQPWYENSSAPNEEDIYYRNSVSKASSYWLNFK